MIAPVWHRVELYAVRKLHVLVWKGSLELSRRLLLAFMSMTTSGNFGQLRYPHAFEEAVEAL